MGLVHLNPNNMTLSALPGKIPETRKIFSNFLTIDLRSAYKPTDQSCSNSISKALLQISQAVFILRPTLKKLKNDYHQSSQIHC